MNELPRNTILAGDVTARLAQMPTGQVDCVITSPPYYQLRDYGVTGQLGLEPTVEDWVIGMRQVMRTGSRTETNWFAVAQPWRHLLSPRSLRRTSERTAPRPRATVDRPGR
jgi:DNA modification methylase